MDLYITCSTNIIPKVVCVCVCVSSGCASLIAGISLNFGWNSPWKYYKSRIGKAEVTVKEPPGASIYCSTCSRSSFLFITAQCCLRAQIIVWGVWRPYGIFTSDI